MAVRQAVERRRRLGAASSLSKSFRDPRGREGRVAPNIGFGSKPSLVIRRLVTRLRRQRTVSFVVLTLADMFIWGLS
jgi:hypothetical protein